MMQIETGGIYRVKHRCKGNFYLAVRFTDKNFTTGMILEGNTIAMLEGPEVSAGKDITVRNSFCKFETVLIKEAV